MNDSSRDCIRIVPRQEDASTVTVSSLIQWLVTVRKEIGDGNAQVVVGDGYGGRFLIDHIGTPTDPNETGVIIEAYKVLD